MLTPANGSTIIFDRAPNGSWARIGEAYKVAVSGKGRRAVIHLTNVARGSGTFDSAYAYGAAIFRVVKNDA